MIFLTIGTTRFPFLRLLRAVDKALVVLGSKEKVVVQIGKNDYQFVYGHTTTFSEIPFDKMIYYFSRARVVISHGGLGTLFLTLKCAKNKPLVIPRCHKFSEHVDDHQVFLVKFLKKKGLIKAVFPDDNLTEKTKRYLESPEKLPHKKRILGSKELVKKLIKCTESVR